MAYDLENWGGLNRASFNALISERDQVEYYYPAWRAAVQGGRTGSVMCSCECAALSCFIHVCSSTTHVCIHPRRADNAVNGVPSCANSEFLNGVLRDQYGFDGLVVSDCGAIDHIHSQFKPGDPSTTGGNNQPGVMKPGFPANSSDATMLAVRKPLFPLQCAAQCRNVWPRSAMPCQNKMISTNCAREMCS
jgi:hypothetical protein